MTVLVMRKLLHTTNAVLVEVLHVVTCISKKEIIGAHTQPEEVNLLICIGSMIIYTRDFSCRE